ncbi:MAG: hypothetical protein NC102_02490 [Clostridium sp.]|nr:hypothetical protein [Clostridium sp.]
MKRDYFALWGLLAAAFIIFLGISAFGDEVSIGGSSWRTSGMAKEIFGEGAILPNMLSAAPDSSVLSAPSDSTALSDLADSTNVALDVQIPDSISTPSAPADSAGLTILFIGDSMLEGLGQRLAAYCDASGHKLYTVIWYSSTSEIWGNAKLLSKYISQVKPQFIFICLGANELFVRDIATKRDKHVKSILAEAGSIPYLWIGPPNWKEDTGINDLVASNVPKGRFFLTNGMKFNRKKDGAHPTYESAALWMDSVIRWMPVHCPDAPIFSAAEKTKARPARQYIHQPGANP